MPILHINYNPLMTKHLVEKGVFKHHPLSLIDIGAAGGYESFWDVFGNNLNVIGFEPRKSEWEALNASAPNNVTYIPCALGKRNGLRDFYITRQPLASSFCSGETDFIRRFPDETNLETVEKVKFETRRLDDILEEYNVQNIDFIKIDVDGAELDVLLGAVNTLRNVSTLGLVTEFWFHREMRKGCSTFSQIDQFMNEAGFRLYDIDVYRHSRKVLQHPSRFIHQGRPDSGNPSPGPTPLGQVMTGDALYLRDYVGDFPQEKLDSFQILKLACLYEIYGLCDCAAEVILHWKDLINKITNISILMDILTEEWTKTKKSYIDYIRNGPDKRRRLLTRATPLIEKFLQKISEYDGRLTPVFKSTCRWAIRKVSRNL